MGIRRHVFSESDNATMATVNAQLGILLVMHTARLAQIMRKYNEGRRYNASR